MNEWSDDEDEAVELSQPNRDMPISSEDDEEEEYDMEEIRNLTLKKENTMWNDIVKQDFNSNKIKSTPVKHVPEIKKNIIQEKKYEKRKFNPRLPPPNKNRFNNHFKLNENDFPSL
jgi:hypothetical protein